MYGVINISIYLGPNVTESTPRSDPETTEGGSQGPQETSNSTEKIAVTENKPDDVTGRKTDLEINWTGYLVYGVKLILGSIFFF